MALIDNIQNYWKLDESSGDAIDAVASNDGTVTGATQGADGKIGTSYSFDGVNDSISFTNDVPTTTGTINFWMYPTFDLDDGLPHYIYNSANAANTNNRISFNKQGTDLYDLGIWNSTGTRQVTITFADEEIAKDTWSMVTITYTTNSVFIYVNNVEKGTDTSVTTPSGNPASLYIGTWIDGALFDYAGRIDEVGVWTVVLSSAERDSLYNSGNGLTHPFTVTTSAMNQAHIL